jgi:hypothetical protein
MAHVHQWLVHYYLLLTLPDADGFGERVMSWECQACGYGRTITGWIKLGEPLHTPDFWHGLLDDRGHSTNPTLLRR